MQRIALWETILVLLLLGGACAGLLIWAAHAQDSELARSIRRTVGIAHTGPKVIETVPSLEPAPVPAASVADIVAEPVFEPEPAAIPEITFSEVAAQRRLWPATLTLKLAVQVDIRYNGKDYGYMEFLKGRQLRVDAVMPSGEIFCQIDGNFLSLSVYQTDFYGWFKQTHGERYRIEAVEVDFGTRPKVRHKIGTPQGEADFWAEMRIWCHQNYDSVSLDVGQDSLVFKWLPREDAPIDFSVEAREIARNYLLKRAKFGGRDNYAACEIRHPATDELLGASSIFIPRL